MGRKSDPGRAAFWRGLIERRRRDKLSVDVVCEQAGVSTSSFYRWLRQLGGETAGISGRRPRRQAQADFVPITIVADEPCHAAGMIEIELPSRIRLRVPSPCDAQTLRAVWDVVRGDLAGGPS